MDLREAQTVIEKRIQGVISEMNKLFQRSTMRVAIKKDENGVPEMSYQFNSKEDGEAYTNMKELLKHLQGELAKIEKDIQCNENQPPR